MSGTVAGGHALIVPLYWLCAGVALFAGIHSAVLGIIGHRRWMHFPFALSCLGVVAVACGSAWFFIAPGIDEAVFAQRWLSAGSFVFPPSFALTVSAYTRQERRPAWIWLIAAACGFMLLLNFNAPYSLRFESLEPAPPLVAPWGEVFAQFKGPPTIWVMPYRILAFVIWFWSFLQAVKLFLSGERTGALLLGTTVVAMVGAHLWSILIVANVVHSFYITAFAYVFLIAAISITINLELRDTALSNVELDRVVKLRTAELEQDIRERMTVEATLRDTQSRLRVAIESGGIGTWMLSADGKDLWWDEETYRLWGQGSGSGRNLDSEKVLAAIVEQDREGVREAIGHSLRERSPYRRDFRIRRPDGRVRWLSSVGIVSEAQGSGEVRLAGATIDTTDRKRQELMLAAQNRVLAMIASDHPLHEILAVAVRTIEDIKPEARCAVFLADENGERLRVGAAPSLPSDLIRSVDGMLLPGEAALAPFGLSVARGEPVVIEDFRTAPLRPEARSAAMACGFLAATSIPIFDTARSIIGSFDLFLTRAGAPSPENGIFIDSMVQAAAIAIESERSAQRLLRANADLDRKITERTRELSIAHEKLKDFDRLKSSFLANLSHELRTPLNAVIGFTDNLLMRTPGPLTADQERQLSIVRNSSQTLLRMISDLLDMAKREADRMSLVPEPIDCQQLSGEIAARYQPQALGHSLSIQVELPPVPLWVYCDRRTFSQIVSSLMDAAIHLGGAGVVTLTVTEQAHGTLRSVMIAVHSAGLQRICEQWGSLLAREAPRVSTRTDEIEDELLRAKRFALLIGGSLEAQRSDRGGCCLALVLPERG